MTNAQCWLNYTEGLSSPQNFIEWSYRYLIGSALQRRVWVGPEHQPCFANTYTILVANPGIGKGLVIREVSNCLKHWKLKDSIKLNEELKTDEHKQTAAAVHEADLKVAIEKEMQPKNRRSDVIEPLLIPVAADATTYEALVEAVADSYRRINYIKHNTETGKDEIKVYGHSSLCFSLQELGSLLRKRTDDTVNYMLGLYDCPADYEYNTKTQGKERVRRGCLNLLAGTTPGFMQSVFNEKLIDEGFSSRTFFIYANKNRKSQFFIPALTDDQRASRKVIIDHIRKLTTLYGNVRMDTATLKFLETWWEQYNKDLQKSKKPTKLRPYESRKNIHVMKVAIAEHFSDSLEMFIPLETYKLAIDILEQEEKNMHLAITMEGSNPLSRLAKKLLDILAQGKKNYVELHVDTFDIADKKQLEETLSFLQETNQVVPESEVDKVTEKSTMYWRLK